MDCDGLEFFIQWFILIFQDEVLMYITQNASYFQFIH
jgi:hypothetical protein